MAEPFEDHNPGDKINPRHHQIRRHGVEASADSGPFPQRALWISGRRRVEPLVSRDDDGKRESVLFGKYSERVKKRRASEPNRPLAAGRPSVDVAQKRCDNGEGNQRILETHHPCDGFDVDGVRGKNRTRQGSGETVAENSPRQQIDALYHQDVKGQGGKVPAEGAQSPQCPVDQQPEEQDGTVVIRRQPRINRGGEALGEKSGDGFPGEDERIVDDENFVVVDKVER